MPNDQQYKRMEMKSKKMFLWRGSASKVDCSGKFRHDIHSIDFVKMIMILKG